MQIRRPVAGASEPQATGVIGERRPLTAAKTEPARIVVINPCRARWAARGACGGLPLPARKRRTSVASGTSSRRSYSRLPGNAERDAAQSAAVQSPAAAAMTLKAIVRSDGARAVIAGTASAGRRSSRMPRRSALASASHENRAPIGTTNIEASIATRTPPLRASNRGENPPQASSAASTRASATPERNPTNRPNAPSAPITRVAPMRPGWFRPGRQTQWSVSPETTLGGAMKRAPRKSATTIRNRPSDRASSSSRRRHRPSRGLAPGAFSAALVTSRPRFRTLQTRG